LTQIIGHTLPSSQIFCSFFKNNSHIWFSPKWKWVVWFSGKISLMVIPWGDQIGMPRWHLDDAWEYLWYSPNTSSLIISWFFLPKPGFLKFIWIFSGKNHLKISISYLLKSKSYQIKIFPTTPKAHTNSSKFSAMIWFNLIFREEIIQYSKTFAL
jgi:hypothetical protein